MLPYYHTFSAIIFDLDGVLVDTEPLVWDVYCEIFKPFGIRLTKQQELANVGVDMPETARYLLQETGLSWTPTELIGRHLTRLYERFQSELIPFPGTIELIQCISRAGIPLGVASNSPVDYVRRVLHAIGIEKHILAVVGQDQVAKPKPFPDVYLSACKQLQASPARCLAIEDSTVGLQAALAAGMAVAWIHEPAGTLPANVWRFNNLLDLTTALNAQ